MSKLNKSIVAEFESAQITRELPKFSQGDTVVVNVKVKEGSRERVQAYEGVVIATKNAGLNSSFTVRKISHGYGVERVFQTHSAIIDSVEVKRRGKVRAGKLYYLRGLEGKAARIKEDRLPLLPPRLPVWPRRPDKQLRLLPRRPPSGGRLRFRHCIGHDRVMNDVNPHYPVVIQSALRFLDDKGLARAQSAPLLHRLLWRAGIALPPRSRLVSVPMRWCRACCSGCSGPR